MCVCREVGAAAPTTLPLMLSRRARAAVPMWRECDTLQTPNSPLRLSPSLHLCLRFHLYLQLWICFYFHLRFEFHPHLHLQRLPSPVLASTSTSTLVNRSHIARTRRLQSRLGHSSRHNKYTKKENGHLRLRPNEQTPATARPSHLRYLEARPPLQTYNIAYSYTRGTLPITAHALITLKIYNCKRNDI